MDAHTVSWHNRVMSKNHDTLSFPLPNTPDPSASGMTPKQKLEYICQVKGQSVRRQLQEQVLSAIDAYWVSDVFRENARAFEATEEQKRRERRSLFSPTQAD